jgi:hypothetical protein
VEQATKYHSTDLLFGGDVGHGVVDVSPDAGPPEKILEHLKTLAEMARIRRDGSLGKNVSDWLAERGISASAESELIENNKTERQKRTWDDGIGKRFFSSHLKPNESTGPDKCVRIYYEFDEPTGKVIVGWIGRHP